MKSLSSAIVAAAGVFCFATGAWIPHDDTQGFVMLVGGVVGVLGLVGWALSFRPTDLPAEAKPFQFGLGTLMCMVTVVCLLIGGCFGIQRLRSAKYPWGLETPATMAHEHGHHHAHEH